MRRTVRFASTRQAGSFDLGTVEKDDKDEERLAEIGFLVDTYLRSPQGTEPGAANWSVTRKGMDFDIENEDLGPFEGDGSPLVVTTQNRTKGEKPEFWILGQNRVRGENQAEVLAKLYDYPTRWDATNISQKIAQWARDEAEKLGTNQDAKQKQFVESPTAPGGGVGGAPPGGMGGGGMPFASRRARLAQRVLRSLEEV
ncbi:MAG: hypothetical protein E6R03_17400 [Hyphomicrobiaceae bacterium]|nr:MAG: hypothetical protein E6R03_17400 [Hyphomicrobiaceae bacterium]